MKQNPPAPQSPAPRTKVSRRMTLAGVAVGSVVTATGLLVAVYCAYMSWKKVYATEKAPVADAVDLTAYFQTLHTVTISAVGVTVIGAAVLVASLLLLPKKK